MVFIDAQDKLAPLSPAGLEKLQSLKIPTDPISIPTDLPPIKSALANVDEETYVKDYEIAIR
jgi:hypothetical protein